MNSADAARSRTPGARPGGFDVAAFFAAIDDRRQAEGMSWSGLAIAVWEMSSGLVARNGGHPISGSTIQNMQRRGGTCQHALLVLWWLDRAPEEFVVRPRPGTTGVPLPDCDPDHRLRWNLAELYAALNDARTQRGGDVAAGRDPAALHRESAHRAAHRQVRHQHATGHADHPGAAASGGRLHRGRDLVTGRLS